MRHRGPLLVFVGFTSLIAACQPTMDPATGDYDLGAPPPEEGMDGSFEAPEGDDDETEETFAIEGIVRNVVTGAPGGGGLCVFVEDPGLSYEDRATPELLVTTWVERDARFRAEGIPLRHRGRGLLVTLDDCIDDISDFTLRSASVLSADEVDATRPGEVVFGIELQMIDQTAQAVLQGALERALDEAGEEPPAPGFEDGLLLGVVRDADGSPLEGAEVRGPAGVSPWYLGGDLSLRAEGGTDAEAGSIWLIPAAPLDDYSALADGVELDAQEAGSLRGQAVFLPLHAG